MTSKTGFISQESPANALALNKDNSQVVIAGRNVFKIFTLYEDKFEEACNLRVGKNLNLNFSCNDIAWNLIDHHILATAATNGAVVLWNLNKVSRSKQEHVFTDHKRTVNKVSFHMTEPMWLISGSQDGTMKCFDLRIKEAVKTFYSNTESVRDVQFSPHQQHTFAAVSENGHVQQWDLRRPDRYYQYFTAHSGPIFACDWHPEMTWLATASRDKTIKIWDLSIKPKCFYTINTIASVGRIRWRPQRKYHIASCALVVDCSINVWDIRRPFIPFASFNEHKDVPTGVAWRGNPQSFLSTSRDCTLYHHLFQDATRPANKANPQGIALNCNGDVAYACKLNNYYNNNHYNINCNDILTTTILTTTTTTMMTTTTATITTSSSSSLSSSSTIIAATLTNEIEGDVENEIETETEAEVSVAASSPTTTTATTSSITIPTTSTMIQTPTAISPSPPSITTILLPPPPPLPTTTTSITATTILPSLSSSASSSSLLLSTTTLTSSSSTTTLSSSPSSIIMTTTTTTTTTTSTSTTTTAAAVITTMAPTLSSSSSSTSLSASTATTTTITKPLKNSTRKIPTSSDQFCMATSIMHRFTLTTKPRGPKWFKICAEEYLLSGRLSDICDKNAKIASSCGRHDVCAIWNIIKTLYESPPKKNNNSNNKSNNGLFKKSTNIKNIELSHDVKKMKQNGINNNNNVSIIEDDIETDEISENFIFPRLSICRSDYRILLNDHKRDAKGDFFFGESELDPMTTIDYNNDTTNNDDTNNSNNNNNNSNNNSSNNNNNNDDSINNNANAITNNNSSSNDNTTTTTTTTTATTTTTNNSNDNDNCGLNREAFPLRHEIQDRSPPPEQYPNNSPEIIDGSVSAIDDQPCQLVLTNIPKPLFWDPTEVVKEALKHHAAIRDVQTSATILIALGNKRNNLNFEIAIQEHWLLEYIDMLARFKLYNVITQIIQLAWIPSVSQLNQQSTMIHVCCTSCTKPLQRSAWICDRCHTSKHALCSICHQVVKGVYAWCQGCTHGGHLLHMKEWFINNRCCPTGCGHICEYT